MSKVRNPNGNPVSLVPAEPGNTRALKHAVYSERLREPRAREIAEGVMTAPWATDLDELAAAEIGRLTALIESLEEALADVGYRSAKAAKLLDLRLRASRRLTETLGAFGLTPHARAEWTARLTSTSWADYFHERLAELEEEKARRAG